MHMQVMEAPDIRWSTLASGAHGDHAEHGEGEDEAAIPYDFETFKGAVTQGISPGGRPFSSDMPRWGMSDADLEALIAFLKTLP
jgi:hypothetical protein